MLALMQPPGWRDGKPPIITQGDLDGDAVVYELFPMQTVVFDARVNSFQSIPQPTFPSAEHKVATLSVMIKSTAGFSADSRVRLWIQNAVQCADDPSRTFAADTTGLAIELTPTPPVLKTTQWSIVGPSLRLRVEWQQGSTTTGPPLSAPASATFAVWLTLRRA